MATEFTLTLENRPGTLAELGEVLGGAGVNIDAMQGMPCEGRGVIQLVTNNPDGAAQALSAANIQHTSREVLVVNVTNEPGAMGRVTRAMADQNINVDAFYIMMDGKIVMGVDNLEAATSVATGMGAM